MSKFYLVIFFSFSFSSYSVASPISCSSLFSTSEKFDAQEYQQSIGILRSLNNEGVRFSEWLEGIKSKPQEMNKDQFLSWMHSFEKMTENYLNNSSVDFIKTYKEVSLSSILGLPSDFSAMLPLYQTSGKPGHDLALDSLHGAQNFLNKQSMKLIFSPLLFVERPNTSGYFDFRKGEIVISAFGLFQDNIGVSATLAHEYQHALEHIKLLNRKPTLASFVVRSSIETSEAYSKYLAMDEIDTHFAELKFMKNLKDEYFKYLPEGLKEKAISLRAASIAEQKEMLGNLLEKAMQILSTFQEILDGRAQEKKVYFVNGVLYAEFHIANSTAFDTFIFRTTARDDVQIQLELKKQLSWAKIRVGKIKAQFDKISDK